MYGLLLSFVNHYEHEKQICDFLNITIHEYEEVSK